MPEIKLDGRTVGPSNFPLPLSLGAIHELTVQPHSDSPWKLLPVNLQVDGSASVPGNAITTTPSLGAGQNIEEGWLIHCTANQTGTGNYRFEFRTEYTAPPYLLPVTLGDNRIILGEVKKRTGFPIVKEAVTVGIQVLSFYTNAGARWVDVIWNKDEGGINTVPTNEEGWSYFLSASDVAGRYMIKAKFFNKPENEHIEHMFFVNVLTSREELTRDGSRVDLDGVGVVLVDDRNGEHELRLLPNEGFDTGSKISLNWVGDEVGGVSVEPPVGFEQEITNEGCSWRIRNTFNPIDNNRRQLMLKCADVESLPFAVRKIALNSLDSHLKLLVNGVECNPAGPIPIKYDEEFELALIPKDDGAALGLKFYLWNYDSVVYESSPPFREPVEVKSNELGGAKWLIIMKEAQFPTIRVKVDLEGFQNEKSGEYVIYFEATD